MATISSDSQITKPGQTSGQITKLGYSVRSSTSDDHKPVGNRYFGSLVLVAAIIPLPFLAGFITLLVYLSPSSLPEIALFQWLGSSNLVIILGLIITLILWLLLAIPCTYFARAEGGRPSDYASLRTAAGVLRQQFEVFKCERAIQVASEPATAEQYNATIADIESNFRNFDNGFKDTGLPWVSYSGYVSMWDRINKVNEAMVDILPGKALIESANNDILSLTDSDVPNSKCLLISLNDAICTLRSSSKGPQNSTATYDGQDSRQGEQIARANIRQVKSALHKFTNNRWDGLVRARSQLMGTAFLTSIFTYIFVIIAILVPVPGTNIIHAMVFYFLGAIVGLFGRLFDERNTDKVIDDYGLGTTRIIVTPFISGLAVLIGLLFVTSSSNTTLYEITLQNLVFAAILGFAPNILISTLQSKSEEIKGQLKGANPSGGKSGKGSSGSSKENSNVGSG